MTLAPPDLALPLFFVRHGEVGGVESALYNLVSGLNEVGTNLLVGVSDSARLAPGFVRWLSGADRVRVHRQPALPGPGAVRFAEESLFDLVSGSSPVLYPNYFVPPMKLQRRYRATLVHDSQFRVFPEYFSAAKRRWLDFCYRNAASSDAVLFISEHERDMFIRHLPAGRQLPRSAVVYNAIDIERYASVDEETHQNMKGRRYVLAVSHQFPHKNIATLVDAFVHLARRDKDIELWLVGTTGSDATSRLAGEDASIAERVHNTGFVTDAELAAYYRSASLFVHPSLYEGFGMTAVEAIALELPVLVSDAAALPEVTRGHAQVVPAQSNSAEWAEHMRAALDTLTPSSDRGAAARDVLAAYHPNAVAKRVLDAMELS